MSNDNHNLEINTMEDASNLTVLQKKAILQNDEMIQNISGLVSIGFTLSKDEIVKVHNPKLTLSLYLQLGITFQDVCYTLCRKNTFDKTLIPIILEMMDFVIQMSNDPDILEAIPSFIVILIRTKIDEQSSFIITMDQKYGVLNMKYEDKTLLELLTKKATDYMGNISFLRFKEVLEYIINNYEKEFKIEEILEFAIQVYQNDIVEIILEKGYVPSQISFISGDGNWDIPLIKDTLDLLYKYIDPEVLHVLLMQCILDFGIDDFIVGFMIVNKYLAKYHDIDDINQQIMGNIDDVLNKK